VITSGGLIGKIDAVNQSEIKLELSDKVRVRVAREDVELYTASETDQ
jgi:preprotein translocase subunit YajC